MHTVLVLGGYGFFGQRIAAGIADDPGIRLLIAGRDLGKARAKCVELGMPHECGVVLDADDPTLASHLRRHAVDTVVHTAGPFQCQQYGVARAAIAAGCHYIDLADGRQFVCGIAALHREARERGVTIISGASSVPALSSAVIERYRGRFARLERIAIGIASGARTPGIATMKGVFGYCGRPIRHLERGRWTETYGWLDLTRYRFADPVGTRLLGSCDVPDLELFPAHYAPVSTVTFHAGFASAPGHVFVWLLANLVRLGVLRSLSPWAVPLNRISRWMEPFVSDKGAMFVEMEGTRQDGSPIHVRWNLIASQNHGSYIPCGASIALARMLAAGASLARGAMPCVALLSVEQYLAPLAGLDIREVSQ
jgi:saccharopine dehydrogenase-like NADP-dependent oxidoreductase